MSITGSGHVRLRQKGAAQGRGGGTGAGSRDDGGRGLWSSASSDEEGGLRAGGSRQSTPLKVNTAALSVVDKQSSAFQCKQNSTTRYTQTHRVLIDSHLPRVFRFKTSFSFAFIARIKFFARAVTLT